MELQYPCCYIITSKMGAYNVFNNEFILQRVLYYTLGSHFFYCIETKHILCGPLKKGL